MAHPLRKLKEYRTAEMRVIKGGKSTKNKTIISFIVAFLLGAISIFIILNSIDGTPSNISIPDTGVDWDNPPCSPSELNSDWVEVTPELMKERSQRREFQHKKTKLKIAFDKGISGLPKYRGENHWHIYNPYSKSVRDYYLDKNGNPIHKNNGNSHIEINCN